MELEEDQSLTLENEDLEIPSAGELGHLLKQQREKLGLSLNQLSEKTRVRAQFLEAMEEEAWDSLPSPGFVRGFMRSYARAVGLETDRVLSLYEATTFSHEPGSEKHPSTISVKKRSVPVFLIILLIVVLIGGGAYYAWKTYGPTIPDAARLRSSSPDIDEQADQKETEAAGINAAEVLAEGETVTRPAPSPETAPEAKPTPDMGQTPLETREAPEADKAAQVPSAPAEEAKVEQPLAEAAEKTPAPDLGNGHQLTLKAMVKERTWVRIFVDDREPKEYVFQPGSHPQWEANKGFELLIGNAGGIDLEFNGKPLKDLGESGKVIRLFFPEGYKQNRSED
ncbi:MAG: DUF4115 domain-containing protein [Deltaproteobacteria bacterium]|jgi:cytoskeleton protein RodZ